jgi:hypothetical protein
MSKTKKALPFRRIRLDPATQWRTPPEIPLQWDTMAKQVTVNLPDVFPERDSGTGRDKVAKPGPTKQRPDAVTAIVGAVFDTAVSKEIRRRLHHSQALAVVVLVPTAAWVAPATVFFRATFGERWTRPRRSRRTAVR